MAIHNGLQGVTVHLDVWIYVPPSHTEIIPHDFQPRFIEDIHKFGRLPNDAREDNSDTFPPLVPQVGFLKAGDEPLQ